ncbi:MAG: MerR family transcriptional regulator [Candidatus Kapaibacterium sp.]
MQKLYYSISEVSKLVDEEQHILRYWEKEFGEIKPRKNRAGNRVYSIRDLNVIKTVKKLLRDEKLSLKGAKEKIKEYPLEFFENMLLQEENIPLPRQEENTKHIEPDKLMVTLPIQELQTVRSLLSDIKIFLKTSN